ncbi:hypothetical protein F4813DRAFT_346697 [Daldinia decipiens]|uniref:uncharacterized protein n=1 Tax=Daldinia decipiens TaxID=326647 RepID=UPI0020C1D436|nr:uncharacterized protein F4813DRAFT_346697 [Daldinia decipiens]KAI1661185.1 hypothetical protein F4813DRAFT_346697 [Daldinia decipiens]
MFQCSRFPGSGEHIIPPVPCPPVYKVQFHLLFAYIQYYTVYYIDARTLHRRRSYIPYLNNMTTIMSVEQPHPSNGLDEARKSVTSRISKESREQSRNSFASYSTCEEDLADVFADMDDTCMIEEATVLDAREVTIATPKLPERSALRTSRLLNTLQRISTEPITDPHDAYLSSEEDASSSADDFSDYECDSNSDQSEKSPARRKSQEDTARAVSVIYVGKPFVVDLASGRRSVSPIRRPRTRSSSPSIRTSSFEGRPGPLRATSFASAIDIPRESPSFLSQDPFATNNYKLESASKVPVLTDVIPRAKTPFHRLQRSMNLVRKRSRPNLKDAASRDSILSLRSISTSTTDLQLTLNTLRTAGEEEQQARRSEPVSATPARPQTPVTYNDIMMSARRESNPRLLTKLPPSIQPASPSPTTLKRGILSGLNMNRRRSLRLNKP